MFRTANYGKGRGDALPYPESAHPEASTSQVKQQTGDFKTNDDFISFDALGDDGDAARGRGRQQNGYRGSDTVVGNGVHYSGGKFAGKRGQKRNISQVLEEEGKEKLKDAVTSTYVNVVGSFCPKKLISFRAHVDPGQPRSTGIAMLVLWSSALTFRDAGSIC